MDMFNLDRPGVSPVISTRRKLYSHQATAIESAFQGLHTLVCTGTGSGKSLCYLLPIIASALENKDTSLLMFPTKALAQDQITKINSLLEKFPDIQNKVRPGIIDGDTSHAERRNVAKDCNIILTNPDTLHASILPNWQANYKSLLGRIKYVVIDEAHMYEGVFGSHVAMVLSRFVRLAALCWYEDTAEKCGEHQSSACSATLLHPEHHFRFLCPIPKEAKVTVLSPEDDGSPRAVKHFFVWNPPLMDVNGFSAGRVTFPKRRKVDDEQKQETMAVSNQLQTEKWHKDLSRI
jgi:DEAD/DEAH box helicase domain-containing protein